MWTKSCPVCKKYPHVESYTFKGEKVYLVCCEDDCVVPDELKSSEAEAREEWNRCVEEENDA